MKLVQTTEARCFQKGYLESRANVFLNYKFFILSRIHTVFAFVLEHQHEQFVKILWRPTWLGIECTVSNFGLYLHLRTSTLLMKLRWFWYGCDVQVSEIAFGKQTYRRGTIRIRKERKKLARMRVKVKTIEVCYNTHNFFSLSCLVGRHGVALVCPEV